MEFQVDIKPEDINRAIVDAVSKSLIGDQIRKIISAQVESLSRSYNNPLDGVVSGIISGMVRDIILSDEFKPAIEKAVRARLTDDLRTQLVDKAWDALMNR